jgi:hypothetical protein
VDEPDGRLVVMRRGDGIELGFDDVPPPDAGMAQTFLLRVELVYKPRVGVDFGPVRGWTDQVMPLPLRDMGTYRPGSESPLARSELIRRYLAEYNTRCYERGDTHWAPSPRPHRGGQRDTSIHATA